MITPEQHSREGPISKGGQLGPWKQGPTPKRRRVIGAEVTGKRKPNVRSSITVMHDTILHLLATQGPTRIWTAGIFGRRAWEVELDEALR